MATINIGRLKPVFQGAYDNAQGYVVDDIVTYSGETYICILASTGNVPTNTTYWSKMASKGADGVDADLFSISGTAQGDLYYNNGSAIARLGAGTSGQFLKTLGTGANPTWSDAGGGLQSMQVFTSSGTYTKPAGINKIKVYVTGAGGGGGASASTYSRSSGSGGSAGGTAIEILDATSITTVSVTIGAGGAGSTGGGNTGGTGGTSSFGSYCSGVGGQGGRSAQGFGGAREGGNGAGGTINLRGQGAGSAIENAGGAVISSSGGNSFWGGGASGVYSAFGTSGQIGGGGSGGSGNSTTENGGSGGDGIVVVEEYK